MEEINGTKHVGSTMCDERGEMRDHIRSDRHELVELVGRRSMSFKVRDKLTGDDKIDFHDALVYDVLLPCPL